MSDQVITAQEIADSQGQTAYEVIMKVRANFLSNRGKTTIMGDSPSAPTVYLDGQMYGDVSTLKNISAKTIGSIRLYRAWDASTKFGAHNVGGVIEVISRTR
ncbi:MAG: Plug domain-containing protein [bacterium]